MKTWIETLKKAKAHYALGASPFTVGCILDEAKDLYKEEKEKERKKKKMTFEEIGTETGRLVNAKNKAYGDSFSKSGDVIKILYPKGIAPDQYGDMLAIVRIIDKFFRIATDKDAFGESPWQDITGYALLKVAQIKKRGQKGENGK